MSIGSRSLELEWDVGCISLMESSCGGLTYTNIRRQATIRLHQQGRFKTKLLRFESANGFGGISPAEREYHKVTNSPEKW
jgi:hypothetical protein